MGPPAALHATACKNCRRRGRKCDRTLPTCLSCERRSIACEGYVTRWPGVASRGKLAGKAIPVVQDDDSSAIHRKTKGSIVWRNDAAMVLSKQVPGNRPLNQGLLPLPSPTNIDDLSSIFYLGNGLASNPMFRYVLPLVGSVPSIRYALAASTLCHHTSRAPAAALKQKSLHLRVRATHTLRQRLSDAGAERDYSVVASILMLAQVDMCSGDCLEFETHLQAAVAIVRALRHRHADNRYYFEQRLVWLDIISSTTSPRLPYFTTEEVSAALGRFHSPDGSREWGHDVFPCPIDLFEILIDVAFLYKTQSQPESRAGNTSLQVLEQAGLIMDRLSQWSCPPDYSGPRKHTVRIWQLGIMAYLQRLFPAAHHVVDVAALRSQLLHLAEALPPASSWSYSLLWPIFQIGTTLDDDSTQEKEWIRQRLEIALAAVGCRHFSNALEALEVLWDRPDRCSAPPATGTYGRTIMLG